jgi:3',5'-cyclic AMP phosphodiesterase CpdA
MADPSPLLTILHISDLHIGYIDGATGNSQVSTATSQLFANCSWCDGVQGHHARALDELDDFFWKELGNQNKNFLVIVSGDLTRVGNGLEFDHADSFLGSRLSLPSGEVGFRLKQWRDFAIPGNHDHWPGLAVVLGGPHPRLASYFPPPSLPYIRYLPLANGWELQIIGINTDADVNPRGLKRLRAVGSFQSQLGLAAARLRALRPQQLRVLLMHHSWDPQTFFLAIDRGSRAALDQFLTAHGIRILLTGHTHEPLLKDFLPASRGARVLECRCGTTTQVDQVPVAWRSAFGSLPKRKWPDNTFLLHRLYEVRGHVQWTAECYHRDPTYGFQSSKVTASITI